jgi:hypothetical protein
MVVKGSPLLLFLSCSVLVDANKVQCSQDADCRPHGASLSCLSQVCVDVSSSSDGGSATDGGTATDGGSTPWGCIGEVTWPTGTLASVTLTVPVVDVITSAFPADLQVRACSKLDVQCASPLSATVDVASTPGVLKVTLAAGFDGYLELTSPSITPALFFVVKPVREDTALTTYLPVVPPSGFEGIAQAIGTTLDLTTMGHVYALAEDCGATPASGVRFEIDKESAQTAAYYMINNTPVSTAPATDTSGSGGFLNIPTGFVRLTGYVSTTGARIGEAGFMVRRGAVSYPRLMPTPN